MLGDPTLRRAGKRVGLGERTKEIVQQPHGLKGRSRNGSLALTLHGLLELFLFAGLIALFLTAIRLIPLLAVLTLLLTAVRLILLLALLALEVLFLVLHRIYSLYSVWILRDFGRCCPQRLPLPVRVPQY